MTLPVKKIAPPAARTESDRTVTVPPTIGQFDTNEFQQSRQKSRSDFRDEEFERIILQHGKFVVWRKALLCPCLNEVTGQSQLLCARCDSSGFIYSDPLRIQAHMASFDSKTGIYEKFGMWQEGACLATTLPKYRLGFRDSLEMEDAVMTFTELLKKGNRRGIRSKLPVGRDSARYRIVNVSNLFVVDASGVIVNLEPKLHYQIDENGWIQWLAAGDQIVKPDTVVSIHYDFHPVFLVISHPHVTRDDVSGRKVAQSKAYSLPVQAALKLDFLVDVNNPVSPVTG